MITKHVLCSCLNSPISVQIRSRVIASSSSSNAKPTTVGAGRVNGISASSGPSSTSGVFIDPQLSMWCDIVTHVPMLNFIS